MINIFVLVYLNDILIFSKNPKEHTTHVRKVLQRLRLFVKAEKCEFSCTSTTFLGYVISSGNISMDPEKVRAVGEWPKPTDLKALQHFLGFANFYKCFHQELQYHCICPHSPNIYQGPLPLGSRSQRDFPGAQENFLPPLPSSSIPTPTVSSSWRSTPPMWGSGLSCPNAQLGILRSIPVLSTHTDYPRPSRTTTSETRSL